MGNIAPGLLTAAATRLRQDKTTALLAANAKIAAIINLKGVLQFIIRTEAPRLIRCHAGVDRTGFVCMALESFMGASLDEVINDYLMSFNSIFESSIYNSEQKADAVTAMQILSVMSGSQIINEKKLQHTAEIYFRKSIELSAEETELLRRKLSMI